MTSFLCETKSGNDTLGQITSYAAAQFGSQYRTHAYSVLIVKDTARIFRWDRSGTVVTGAFKYNESPFLVEFFRRYSVASPVIRGKDTSALHPTSSEAIEARQALGLDNDAALVKLLIHGPFRHPLYYILSAPQATPYVPPGRATRGGPAYDVMWKTRVYLKDSWRVDLPDIQAEGLTYTTLMNTQVCNIAQCLVSGDILDSYYHTSQTHKFAPNPCSCYPRTHFIPH